MNVRIMHATDRPKDALSPTQKKSLGVKDFEKSPPVQGQTPPRTYCSGSMHEPYRGEAFRMECPRAGGDDHLNYRSRVYST